MARPRRKFRTEDEIRDILSDWATGDEPAAAVARRYGVNRSLLYLWRQQYGAKPAAAARSSGAARRRPEPRALDVDRLTAGFTAAVTKAVEAAVRQQVTRLIEQVAAATREQVRRELLQRLGTE